MTSLQLGPLALPAAPLLLLLSAWLASWLADRMARSAEPPRHSPSPSTSAPPSTPAPPRRSASAGALLTQATWLGLLVARVAHVAPHLGVYLTEPWSLLDLRDGGWNGGAGLVGGLAWVGWQAWRHPAWRKALATGAAAGVVLWSAGSAGLAALTPRDLPDVTLTDLTTGQPVSLRELSTARHPIVLTLWATWCGFCRREMPILAAAQAQHPEVLFVFANQGESAELVRRHLDTEGLHLTHVLLDPPSRLGPALGSSGLPTTVFFNRQGQRVDAHVGVLNAAGLAAKLEGVVGR